VRARALIAFSLFAGCHRASPPPSCAALLAVASEGSCHEGEARLAAARETLANGEPACLRVLADAEGHDRTVTAVLVAEAFDPAWLADPSPRVRRAAVSSLAVSPRPDGLALARGALADPAAEVRAEALGVIARLGPPATAVEAAVAPLTADASPAVRGAAASALAAVKARGADDRLLALLDDPSEDVRVRAVYAVKELRLQAARAPLVRLREEPRPRVRDAAVLALGVLDRPGESSP